jgi:sugar phosphate permease
MPANPIPAYDAAAFTRLRNIVYSLLVISYMTVFFHRMAPGAVASDLMQTFHASGAALGFLAAMYYYIYTAMQLPAGVIADTVGVRLGAAIGSAIAGVGSIIFALAPNFEIAAIGRFAIGLGVSAIFVGMMRANAVWFSEHKYGFISGLSLLLGNLGSILAAGPLAWSLQYASWRAVFVGMGIFSLVLAGLSYWLVRNRPQDAGFPSVREMQGLPPHAPRQQHWLRGQREVLKNRAIWPVFWLLFGMLGSLFAFAGLWGMPLMRDVFHLSRTEASLYTTLMLAGFALSSFGLGWGSDWLGRRKPILVIGSLCATALWLVMALAPWQAGWQGMILFTAIGCASGASVVGYAAAKEVAAPAIAGMALALVNTGLFLGAAIAQPVFGWILDLTWDGAMLDGARVYRWLDYRNALWLNAGFCLLALLGSVFARETFCKQGTK